MATISIPVVAFDVDACLAGCNIHPPQSSARSLCQQNCQRAAELARSNRALATLLARPALKTVVYEAILLTPRVEVRLTSPGRYLAIVEVEGLTPQRSTSADERRAGIRWLDPPIVQASKPRKLIDAACRAVAAAATSTTGETGGPGGLLMTYFRTAVGVKMALRELGEDGFDDSVLL